MTALSATRAAIPTAQHSATPARIRIVTKESALRDSILRLSALCGFEVAGIEATSEPGGLDRCADAVLVAAARTADEAIRTISAIGRHPGQSPGQGPVQAQAQSHAPGTHRMRGGWVLVVAETLTPPEALRAARAGARAMLRSADATPERFARAVTTAGRGQGLMPYEVLVRSFGGSAALRTPTRRQQHTACAPPLTRRQLTVLSLMADGHGNAAIAHQLACSQHTIKNVIYELTALLQVRNRAQAVACAVRSGLI